MLFVITYSIAIKIESLKRVHNTKVVFWASQSQYIINWEYKRKWILLIFSEFVQNDIYLNETINFRQIWSAQKPQLYTNNSKIPLKY